MKTKRQLIDELGELCVERSVYFSVWNRALQYGPNYIDLADSDVLTQLQEAIDKIKGL